MGFIKKLVSSIYVLFLTYICPKKLVAYLGVNFGKGCRFIAVRRQTFGSEPYLITLGNYVSISEGVRFVTHDGGVWVVRNLLSEFNNIDVFGEIVVGDNVFIGMNVIVMPGITIGDNSIVGAGSIVTKDVPNNTVVAGVPAKAITNIELYISKNRLNFSFTKNMSTKAKRQYLIDNKSK